MPSWCSPHDVHVHAIRGRPPPGLGLLQRKLWLKKHAAEAALRAADDNPVFSPSARNLLGPGERADTAAMPMDSVTSPTGSSSSDSSDYLSSDDVSDCPP